MTGERASQYITRQVLQGSYVTYLLFLKSKVHLHGKKHSISSLASLWSTKCFLPYSGCKCQSLDSGKENWALSSKAASVPLPTEVLGLCSHHAEHVGEFARSRKDRGCTPGNPERHTPLIHGSATWSLIQPHSDFQHMAETIRCCGWRKSTVCEFLPEQVMLGW